MEIQIRLGQGERGVEDAVSYAISHRTRAEILALLNEDVRTHDELAFLVGQSPSKIGHHIKELLDDGSIDLAYDKLVRNTVQHYYRAVKMPFFSDEEVAAMPAEERQALAGLVLNSSLAEALAAFWAGKMIHDPRLWLGWRWFNVDMQGRGDIADEQARFWKRMQEIEGEAATRCITSGEATKPIIVISLGFERFRTSTRPPETTLLNQEQADIGTQIRLGQGGRRVEKAVSYAISSRIRVEILAFLNEGVCTRDELAGLTRQPPRMIKHHIKELLDDGSIELADTRRVRNLMQHYYRAVKMPFFNDEEVAAMPAEERQALAGVALEASLAEALAAFWAGKMIHDPRLWLGWRWFNVDMQGRGDIADEQARFWKRMQEIEGEAATRCITSGEVTKSIIVISLGFERFRSPTSPTTRPMTEKLTRR